MQYGPAAAAEAELPYNAMIASFALVLVWAEAAAGIEPNISEPPGTTVCAGAAATGVADRKSANGSASGWCDGGDMSVKMFKLKILLVVSN